MDTSNQTDSPIEHAGPGSGNGGNGNGNGMSGHVDSGNGELAGELAGDSKSAKHKHLYSCLGQVMRERRKALDLSQEQLAAHAGIDRAFLSNLERGQRKPSFGMVARIAEGLKIKYSRLVQKCEQCQEQRAKEA